MDIISLLSAGAVGLAAISLLIMQKRGCYQINPERFPDFAKLLNARVGQSSLRVEGHYKGWDTLVRHVPGVGSGRMFSTTDFVIIPKQSPKYYGFFCYRYPKPTKYTFLKQGIIYFDYPGRWDDQKYNQTWDDSEIVKILDELTNAAEIVETNKEYYKGKPESWKVSVAMIKPKGYVDAEVSQIKEMLVITVVSFCILFLIIFIFGVYFLPKIVGP